MQKQPDFTLREGATDIKDEQGNLLLHIELTANMVIVSGPDGTPLLRSWRDMLKFWAPPLKPPFESSQAPTESQQLTPGNKELALQWLHGMRGFISTENWMGLERILVTPARHPAIEACTVRDEAGVYIGNRVRRLCGHVETIYVRPAENQKEMERLVRELTAATYTECTKCQAQQPEGE